MHPESAAAHESSYPTDTSARKKGSPSFFANIPANPYLIATAAVAASAALRQALDGIAHDNAPLMLFCFAVFVAALCGGFKSGVVALLLSIPTADYLFVEPRYTFFVYDPKGMLFMLGLFGVVGVAICWVIERLNRATAQLRGLAADLQNANTELQSSRARLVRSDERFRMATAIAHEAIWEWNPEDGAGAWTESYLQKFGTPDRENALEWWLTKVHPADRERILKSFLAALNGTAREWRAEYRYQRIDGQWADILDRAYFARNAEGRPVRVIGAKLDMTEAARARAAVRESETRLKTLAAMVPEILFTATPEGEIDYLSKRFTDYTGADVKVLLEGGWLQFIHPEDREKAVQIWTSAIAAGTECGSLYRLQGSDGRYRWFQYHAAPLLGPDSRPMKWYGVCADVDDRVRLEQELQAQKNALQEANGRLHRFAYAVAHDLKEPLRTVGVFTQIAMARMEKALDVDTKRFMRSIVTGVDRMTTMIQDLLQYSRITEASAQPRVEIDLNEAVGKALMNLQFTIEQRSAQISFDHLPKTLAPPGLVASLFQNLLANAIKYCETRPEIHIGCIRHGREWVFSVKDNGIGVDPKYHKTIFEPFRRLHARSQYPGTGIGLASCKAIVEELGGRIWVESAGGAGSTFFFTLPGTEGPRKG